MQGLILQLTRAGFLLLLWLFVWAVLRTLRSDIYAGAARPLPRYSRKQSVLPTLSRNKTAKYLVVTQGAWPEPGSRSAPRRCSSAAPTTPHSS